MPCRRLALPLLMLLTALTAARADSDAFLYTRVKEATPPSAGHTLVAARLSPDGLTFKDLHTPSQKNVPSLGSPLLVSQGKIYFRFSNQIDVLDLATHEAGTIGTVQHAYVHGQRLYLATFNQLRIIDGPSCAAVDIPLPDAFRNSRIEVALLSPDGQRLACLGVPNSRKGRTILVLNLQKALAAPDDPEVTHPFSLDVPYALPANRLAMGQSAQLAWRDNQHLWTLTNADAVDAPFLTDIDIATGILTQKAQLPFNGIIGLHPATPQSPLAVTLLPVPPANTRLRGSFSGDFMQFNEGPTRFGSFELVGSQFPTGLPAEIHFKHHPLARAAAISPDGKKLLFSTIPTTLPVRPFRDLQLFNADTGATTLVDSNSLGSPLWITAADLQPPPAKAAIPDRFAAVPLQPIPADRVPTLPNGTPR